MNYFSNLKNLLSISLLMIYLGGAFHSSWTLIDFYWNRDYYTQNFCINLDAGITQCRASCYLESLLEAENQQNSDANLNTFKKFKIEEQTNKLIECNHTPDLSQFHFFYYRNHYDFDFSDFVFHPPKG